MDFSRIESISTAPQPHEPPISRQFKTLFLTIIKRHPGKSLSTIACLSLWALCTIFYNLHDPWADYHHYEPPPPPHWKTPLTISSTCTYFRSFYKPPLLTIPPGPTSKDDPWKVLPHTILPSKLFSPTQKYPVCPGGAREYQVHDEAGRPVFWSMSGLPKLNAFHYYYQPKVRWYYELRLRHGEDWWGRVGTGPPPAYQVRSIFDRRSDYNKRRPRKLASYPDTEVVDWIRPVPGTVFKRDVEPGCWKKVGVSAG